MRVYENVILDSETVSADTASSSVDCRNLTFCSFQVHAVGTLDADVALQVSNDNVNWVEVSPSSQNFSGNSDGMIEVVDLCASYARVYFTANSGSSVVTVTMTNKGNS